MIIRYGNNFNNILAGSNSNDSLYGYGGNDTLYAYSGNDYLDGGTGNDTMYGGYGNDTFVVNSIYDKVIEYSFQGVDTVNSSVSYTLSNTLENLTLTGSAYSGRGNSYHNIIRGNNYNNALYGNGGNDTLYGYNGNDYLDGGTGNDTLYGGKGNDTFVVNSIYDKVIEYSFQGIDTVNSSVNYTLGSTLENLTLTGSAYSGQGNSSNNIIKGNNYNNALYGHGGNDTLYGLGGNDYLDGGLGNNNLIGGKGNDTYVFRDRGGITEKANEGYDTIYSYKTLNLNNASIERLYLWGGNAIDASGGDNGDLIYGNNAKNVIRGYGGNDTLYGNDGNDYLDGGTGNDTLYGGKGNDTFIVNSIYDKVIEYSFQGVDTVKSSVNYTLGNTLENLTLTGSAYSGQGNNSNNIITGNNYNNALYGNGGNDTLSGLGGNDYLDGGLGNNTLIGGNGNDTYIFRDRGVITEKANEGYDTVYSYKTFNIGNASIERLYLSGTNAINASGGNNGELIYGNAANNVISGYGGNDTLRGGNGNDTLYGGTDNDTLYGENGNDFISGNAGTDTLVGGYGNDYLIGSSTNAKNTKEYDKLYGGSGNDTFALGDTYSGVLYRGTGYAIIQDWNSLDDTIQLAGSAGDYTLRYGNWVGGSALDTAIVSRSNPKDFYGVIQDSTNISFANDLVFV